MPARLFSIPLWRGLFVALLLVLGYLSFKPNPAIQGTPGFPKSLAEWFDLYDYWKNFVGFAALGFCGALAWPKGVKGSRIALFFLLCGIILFFEAVQIPIPRRYGDPKDVLAGSLGILAAMPVALTLRRRICDGRIPSRQPSESPQKGAKNAKKPNPLFSAILAFLCG